MKIIDVHNHIGLSLDEGCGTIDELLKNMRIYHIEKSILFATDEEGWQPTFTNQNSEIINAQKKHPKEIIAFARIEPSAGTLAIDEFKRCCALGVGGLKLKAKDGFDPDASRVILDLIGDREHFPVLMHTDHEDHSQPKMWEPVMADYPHINFIMAHGGKDHYKFCAEVANKLSNAYIDTSTLSLNRTRYLYRHVGPQKLLFASDYPYSHPLLEKDKFEVCIKDKKDLELIFYKNAAMLLGI